MSDLLWTLGSFVVAISLLVTIHEFGHFYVARLCGVKVLRFSIGFGKPIWSWVDRHGTEFAIAPIPLGGYVRMLDGRAEAVASADIGNSFDVQPVAKRIAILAAGPLANLLFAVAALWLIFILGVPSVRPVIGEVAADSIAARSGLVAGSEILAIDGEPVTDWETLSLKLAARLGDQQMRLEVKAEQGGVQTRLLELSGWQLDSDNQDLLGSLGITPFYPQPLPVLAAVESGGAGFAAGLRQGDKLVTVAGLEWRRWQDWVAVIQDSGGKPLAVTLERDGQPMTVTVVPALREGKERSYGYLGISPTAQPWPQEMRIELKYGPFEALAKALQRTWQIVQLILSFLGKLLTGDIALNNLSGPVAIAQGAGASADMGALSFLSFLVLISINLGVFNLLPLPVLDGGHLLFFLIEAIRGKPLAERIQELGFRLGWGILLALMCIALFNDITRL